MGTLFFAPSLIYRTRRDARTFLQFEAALSRRKTRFWRWITLPLRHYCSLWINLPRIAGADSGVYQRRLQAVFKRVEQLSQELPRGRSFLRTSRPRQIQSALVCAAFENLLSLQLTSEQQFSFAVYGQCSEVILDFLEFCQQHGQLDSQKGLEAALPPFESLVRIYRFPAPEKAGPARGDLCCKTLPASTHLHRRTKSFHPVETLVEIYWNNFDARQVFPTDRIPPVAQELCERHFQSILSSELPGLYGVLVLEMHLCAWFRIIKMAQNIGPTTHVSVLLNQSLEQMAESSFRLKSRA